MAAANIQANQSLEQTTLTLPTQQQLNEIKRRTGFESIASQRANFKPIWA